MTARGPRERIVHAIRASLGALPPGNSGLAIALSGGRDSMVLLQSLVDLHAGGSSGFPAAPRAIHVHHGLQPCADDWVGFCTEACAERGIVLEVLRINANAPPGHSPEAWARRCRYEALAGALRQGEALLTAHHRLDQAETVLLQLLRGAGPAGLAAMPRLRPFAAGWHLRPLLEVDADDIAAFAAADGLRWVEDPSNRDPRFDRNYLRAEILPRLMARWPATPRSLSRAARWQAEVVARIAIDAANALAAVTTPGGGAIRIDGLRALPEEVRAAVLRAWILRQGRPLPGAAQLGELLRMIDLREDAVPCVHWLQTEVRRHRGCLVLMSPLPALDPTRQWQWNPLAGPLMLPFGVLAASTPLDVTLTVRFRQGGEACRLRPGGPTRPVKHLLQEWGIPAWLRPGLPLVYAGEVLIAIGDRLTAAALPGISLKWAWAPEVGAPPADAPIRRGS